MRIFHISKKFLGESVNLTPQVPENRITDEEDTIERVCVSPSINGALSAIPVDKKEKLYIYEANTEKYIQPTPNQVPDSMFTGELWLLEKVEFKFYDEIEVTGKLNNKMLKLNMYNTVKNFIFSEDSNDRNYKIWTDGACRGNGKHTSTGGWGFIILENDKEIVKRFGGEEDTTNNRMEMKAIIESLDFFLSMQDEDPKMDITIYTDSQYCCKGASDWMYKWAENGWKTSSGKPVKNKDLWQIMLEYVNIFWGNLKFQKVKGHSGLRYNEMADELANKGADIA